MKLYHEAAGVSIYHGESSPDNITMLGADVFVTDPPYGVGFKGKKTKDTKRVDGGYASTHDTPENVIDVVVPIVAAMVENTVRGAVTPGSRMMFDYPKPDGVGAIFHPSGAGLGKWGFTCWQPVFYYGKCPYLENGMGLRPDSIRSPESAERLGHPCPKPLKTMQFIVRKVAIGGETVIDPFFGSGTTGVACIGMGLRCVGIEKDEGYCEIAAKRIDAASRGVTMAEIETGQTTIFDFMEQ